MVLKKTVKKTTAAMMQNVRTLSAARFTMLSLCVDPAVAKAEDAKDPRRPRAKP